MQAMHYLDSPEGRTAILHVTIVAAVTILCIVGAIRTRRRWARVVLGIVAVPLVLFVLWGIFVISLIMVGGPR